MAEILQQDEIAVGCAAQKRRDGDAQKKARADLDRGRLFLAPLGALLPDVGQPVVAHDLDKGLVQRLVGRTSAAAVRPPGSSRPQCRAGRA